MQSEATDINRYEFEHVSYIILKYPHFQILEQWLHKNVGTVRFDWSNELERKYASSTVFSFRTHKHKRMFDLFAQIAGCTIFDTFNKYATWCENVKRHAHR